jgi:hypothetical protein
MKLRDRLAVLWILMKDTGGYIAKRHRELYKRKDV